MKMSAPSLLTFFLLETQRWWLCREIDGEDGSRRGHLIADHIRTNLYGFQQWQIMHVRRTANRVAHAPARVAVKQGSIERMWTGEPPDCIATIIVAEKLSSTT